MAPASRAAAAASRTSRPLAMPASSASTAVDDLSAKESAAGASGSNAAAPSGGKVKVWGHIGPQGRAIKKQGQASGGSRGKGLLLGGREGVARRGGQEGRAGLWGATDLSTPHGVGREESKARASLRGRARVGLAVPDLPQVEVLGDACRHVIRVAQMRQVRDRSRFSYERCGGRQAAFQLTLASVLIKQGVLRCRRVKIFT